MKEELSMPQEGALPQVRSLTAALCFFAIAGVMGTIALLPDTSTGITIALVIVLGAVCSLSTIIDRLGGRFNLFEIVHLICYVAFIDYGASSLYLLYDPTAAYDRQIFPYLNVSLLLCIVGISAMLYGYYLSRRLGGRRESITMSAGGVAWIAILFAIGLAGHLGFLVSTGRVLAGVKVGGLVSVLTQLIPFLYLSYFLLVYLVASGKASAGQKAFLMFVAVPLTMVLIYIFIGNKTICLTVLGLPVIGFYYGKGRLPRMSVVALILIAVFVVFPLYNSYRNVHGDYSSEEKLSKAVDTLSDLSAESYAEQSLAVVGKRMALINSVAVVVRETGKTVDYQYGSTIYLTLLSLAIPRFVWPDKPEIAIGRVFAREFHILPRWNDVTWVSTSLVGEWYWNFGIAGVIGGMFLTGIGFQVLFRKLGEGGEQSPFRLAAYVSVLPIIMNFEGNMAGWIGSTVRSLILYAVIYWVLRAQRWIVPVSPEGGTASVPRGASDAPATGH